MKEARDIEAVADWLVEAHETSLPFEPFASQRGIADLNDAYDVQACYVEKLREARGVAVAGYKVGLTSLAMQKMCGIDSPVAGVILQDAVHSSAARLDRARYGRLGVEFEVAVRLGRPLDRPGHSYSFDEVEDAVEAVAPAIEIVDDRACDYGKLDILSLVADNAWNAGIVVGEFRTSWPDLASIEGRMYVAGDEVAARGFGRDVLGHPFHSVAWLATHLCSRGGSLRARDIVMSGSMITTQFPSAGEMYRFELGGLGSVTAEVVAAPLGGLDLLSVDRAGPRAQPVAGRRKRGA